MRYLSFAPALALCLLYAQCGGSPPADNARRNSNSNAPAADTAPAANTSAPSVASSHGGGGAANSGSPPPGGPSAPDKPPVATPELDEKIEKAEAKAKAASASAADKQAAAAAHMARGNYYYNAQDTRLYRYALGDFRRALRYEPGNAEAKEKIEMIESIYRSLGRPVPDNGLEP